MDDTKLTGAPPEAARTFEGNSVEEAAAAGLRELGLDAADAEVSVLDRGSRGFLGLGARPARVQVSSRDRLTPAVREAAVRILSLMGVEGEVEVRETGQALIVEIRSGEADGLLIGRKGETLAALQHVLIRMTSRRFNGQGGQIRVDVAGYRSRREDHLRELAKGLAQRVERTGKRAMTEPLSPAERRVVHRALAEFTAIQTHAAGSGVNKRVVLLPARRPRHNGTPES